MSFKDIPEARKCMKLYSLANKKRSKLEKSDLERLRYTCDIVGCPFVCLISKEKFGGVKIKTLSSEHDCGTAFDNKTVDFSTIAQYFKKKLQDNPKYKVREMILDLKRNFELNVSHGKCKRAKRMVLESLDGSFSDEYNKLEAYANELRESNPGSDVVVTLSKSALEEGRRRFLRTYVCFHALKMGFNLGFRPFIGLDGTFLKGKAKGQLLVAVGQDSQNHFYPLAWAVVDKENKNTWNWFLQLLQSSLDLKEGEGITCMSDMQKGLLDAVKTVLPQAHHRYCVRHIESNWCKQFNTGENKKLLWWCAWCTYAEDFKDQLGKLGDLNKDAVEALFRYPPQSWCRAYMDIVCKNQSVDNNLTESFNKWIVDARHKPIIKILEDIRIKTMNLLREHEEEVRSWRYDFSQKCMDLYNEYLQIEQTACEVNANGQNYYEVTEGSDKHCVNLAVKKCTCRSWDLTGIPCPHAIRAILHDSGDPMTEINWWYSKEAFLLTYRHKIHPVRGEKFWKIEPSQAMEPPELVKLVGRQR
ncbi:PREDICTED: uncharacterized protein LOC109229862 [Nicotiana attenuata]|uniref:uncharacterized protein LOC109229862 n=1 Tax=Nicotiana attenuata TaxID=49451 RepID=UPI000904E943|nr:PREDICTED: uncharacterized protein LOC109229862 [Nicotiana attenuata]